MNFNFGHLIGLANGVPVTPSLQHSPPGVSPASPPAAGETPVPPVALHNIAAPTPTAAAHTSPGPDQPLGEGEKAAYLRGVADERIRCAEIFAHPAAAGHVMQASHLAFNTDLPSKQATGFLETLPKPAAAGPPAMTGPVNPFAQMMAAMPNPTVAADSSAAGGNDEVTVEIAAFARLISSAAAVAPK